MAKRRDDDLDIPPLGNAVFAGEEAAAVLAQQGVTGPANAIALARKLKAKGATPDQIHRATSKTLEGTPYAGVHFTADGTPRFEITDHNARMNKSALAKGGKAYLGDVFDHPELYRAVPGSSLPTVSVSGTDMSSYTPGTQEIEIGRKHTAKLGKSTMLRDSAKGPLLHETQHAVQELNRLSPGAAPEDYFWKFPSDSIADEAGRLLAYRRTAGEQEAEATRRRASLNAEQRRARPPMQDMTAPIGEQFLAPDVKGKQPLLGDLADVAIDTWKRVTTREVVEGRPIHQRRLDPRRVAADPETFQFKSGGDQHGVTDRLKGVNTWDPLAAGKQIVYQRANGEYVIADGHQRRGLALRAIEKGQTDVALDAFVLREKDGWTPRDVRAYAALKNIKESSGNALDMAKVMRERPDLAAKSLPMSDAKIRDAVALSKLSPQAFDLVEAGVIKPEHAAAVGAQVKDSARHADMLGEMAKAGMRSAEHARLYVSQAMAAPSISETTGSLFGDETKVRSLLAERARVLDRALSSLKSDKRIFALLEREAANIEAAGNRLAHGANVERADTAGRLAELVEKLSTTRGPVSEMLDKAALAMAEGKPPAQAARAFVTDVGKVMQSGGVNALLGDAAPTSMAAPVDPNQGNMFGEPAKPAGWSDEARAASAEVRKGKAKGKVDVASVAREIASLDQSGDLSRADALRSQVQGMTQSQLRDLIRERNGRAPAKSVTKAKLVRRVLDDIAGNAEARSKRESIDRLTGNAPRKQMMVEDGSPKPGKDIRPEFSKGQFALADMGRSLAFSDGWKAAKSGRRLAAGVGPDFAAGYRQYQMDKSPRAAERAMIQHLAKGGGVHILGNNTITLAGSTMPEKGKPAQTSFLPEPTTKEQIAAAAKAKGKPSAAQVQMDDGMFGSGMNQTDLVDAIKQKQNLPAAPGAGDVYQDLRARFPGSDFGVRYTPPKDGNPAKYRISWSGPDTALEGIRTHIDQTLGGAAEVVRQPQKLPAPRQIDSKPTIATERAAAVAKIQDQLTEMFSRSPDGKQNRTDGTPLPERHAAALTQTENTGVRPVTPEDVARENARREAARQAKPYTPPAPHGPLEDGTGKPAGWSDDARAASAQSRKENAMPKKAQKAPKMVTADDFDFSKAPRYRKTATIRADQVQVAKGGEEVITRQPNKDGKGSFVETKNVAKPGDRIVTRSPGDSYVISSEKFPKLYEADPNNPGVYRSANSGRAVRVKQDVQIKVKWSTGQEEIQTIKKGGVIFKSDIDGSVYGNQKHTFDTDFQRVMKNERSVNILGKGDKYGKGTASSGAFKVGIIPTAQREGRFGLQDALAKMTPAEARAAAKAQGIVVPKGATDADVRSHIVEAAFRKMANRAAAAGGNAREFGSIADEVARNRATASRMPAGEQILPPGLRGTQNEANREAIIKNRKRNAKGETAADTQRRAALQRHKEVQALFDETRKEIEAEKAAKSKARAKKRATAKSVTDMARTNEVMNDIRQAAERSGSVKSTGKVASHVEKLGTTLGTPRHQAALDAIAADKSLSKADLAAIAKQHGMHATKSMSKPAILRAIAQRHNKLTDSIHASNSIDPKGAIARGEVPKPVTVGKPRKQMFVESPAAAMASAKPSLGTRAASTFNTAGTVGLGVGVAAAAVMAANQSAAAGESVGKQAAAAGTAAAVAAAPAAVIGGGLYAAAKMSATAAKFVPGVGWAIAGGAAAYGAVTEGVKAAREGKSAGGIAKAAGWGAVNTVVPIDAALEAAKSVRGRMAAPKSDRMTEFARANDAWKRQQAMNTTQTDHDSARKPGWGPEARIAAAKARGAVALPYGGDATKAPGYVPPEALRRNG